MADRNTPYTAEWLPNLEHRPDPNRVSAAVAAAVPAASAPSALPTAETDFGQLSRAAAATEGSYYDVPMLKAPVWRWEIASYFFLGGLSAGSYILARVAERVGGSKYQSLTRAGTWVALASVIPCPALLIHDLGDPKRFHHMLRVFKPTTPMNVGTWTLVAYSGMLGAAATREAVRDSARWNQFPEDRRDLVGTLFRLWRDAHDLLGIPFAIGLAGYTGVLLSCTANPLWCKNPWLGPLFSASAIASGAAATSLAIDMTSEKTESPSQQALEKIDSAAHVAEVASIAGYLRHAGEKAKPLTRGSMRKHMLISAGCLVGAEVIKRLPLEGRAKKGARMLSSLLSLAGGFSMRWAFVYGGHEAANDPRTARLVSRPNQQRPRTLPTQQPRPATSRGGPPATRGAAYGTVLSR